MLMLLISGCWMRCVVFGRCESINPGMFKDDIKWGNQLKIEKAWYLPLMSLSVHRHRSLQPVSWLKSAIVYRVAITVWYFCHLIYLESWYLLLHPMKLTMKCSAFHCSHLRSEAARRSVCEQMILMSWDVYWLLIIRIIWLRFVKS